MCTARKKNITKNAEEMRKRENTKKKGKKVSEETKHISQQVKYEGVNEKRVLSSSLFIST